MSRIDKPNFKPNVIGKHVSTSSSVYSSHDTDVDYRGSCEDIIEEGDENELRFNGDVGLLASESFQTTQLMFSGNIEHEHSNQTFRSYITAEDDNRSFSSINRSLVRSPSESSNLSATSMGHSQSVDPDATPIVNQTAYYQNYDEKADITPKLENGEFPSQNQQNITYSQNNYPNRNSSTNSNLNLPQRELDAKFKRLSVTIQQSSGRKSGDSTTFLNSFQQNIDRSSKNFAYSTNKTSEYYNKIKSKPGESSNANYSGYDQVSDYSASSNRSSIISYGSELNQEDAIQTANRLSIFSSNNSSINSYIGDSGTPEKSSYNIRGSRISPIKSRNIESNSDDIPIRKDLVSKFEEIGHGHSNILSEREKNEFFILSENNHTSKNIFNLDNNGLNISVTDGTLDPKHSFQKELLADVTEDTISSHSKESAVGSTFTNGSTSENLSSLFIRAIHSFDSSTLQSEADSSICLSFEKDDLAFVHSIDDSGWGEVTLIETLLRGWIPMNYFTIAIQDDNDSIDDEIQATNRIPNSSFLRPLFTACGGFLMNPLSRRTRRGNYTFSIRVINSIRDGVRVLLQETDCLSRSNEIVSKKPTVRKSRKTLLADWYNLMVRANEFKGTSNFDKIEILTLMVYQVVRKATLFLLLWSIESQQIIKRETEKKLHNDMSNFPLLPTPPLAKQRITEINGILYSYLSLIIGRLDLIEHNPVGCDLLESITHQVILLLRELLFISKVGSDFSKDKPNNLDEALDNLLSLVSDLVTAVKCLVVKTLNESEEERTHSQFEDNSNKDYYYTQEGGDLIQIAAKMISAIHTTVASIRKLLDVTGDFKLNAERSYPDYARIKIEPEDFVRKCSVEIAKSQNITRKEVKLNTPRVNKNSNRYSLIRYGKTGELGITEQGADFLQDVIDVEESSFSLNNEEFQPYTNNVDSNLASGMAEININEELLVDSSGNLLGASFKGLIYTLTNEDSPPEYFFVSTFFTCFRSFSDGNQLIEELITRFDIKNTYLGNERQNIEKEIKMKSRRRLIVKMFQLWMESYWNHASDYGLLSTLLNFFNEGIFSFLPLEAMKLIEIASKLSARPLVESKEAKPKSRQQLIKRSITITKSKRKNSISNINVNSRYSMVDGYELSKINTNSSTSSSFKSMTLPLPLGVGNQTSSSSMLLSRNQLSTIERVTMTYRGILDLAWCDSKYINTKNYTPISLSEILPRWYSACDQRWVLSNYRPNLLDFNGLEVAKQLTVIESHIFCEIKSSELLNGNFTSKRAHLGLAPNVRQSIMFTNCLSAYVLESILQPNISQKLRVNIVKTWLKIAISCLYLRNFNSLAAIITSLQSHLITRLKKLWLDLSEKYTELYEYLSGIIHPQKNYAIYRNKLKNFLEANDYNIPIVPYFSLFLQDLTFVADGNPNYRKANTFLNQKIINIDKYLKIARVIANIECLQIPYSSVDAQKEPKRSSNFFSHGYKSHNSDEFQIIPVPPLQELILLELWKICQLNKADDDRAWNLSCTLQPREAT